MNDPNFLARMTGYGVDEAVYEARVREMREADYQKSLNYYTRVAEIANSIMANWYEENPKPSPTILSRAKNLTGLSSSWEDKEKIAIEEAYNTANEKIRQEIHQENESAELERENEANRVKVINHFNQTGKWFPFANSVMTKQEMMEMEANREANMKANGGRRKSRKSIKSRKPRKSRMSRKPRKSRKPRTSRKPRKSIKPTKKYN